MKKDFEIFMPNLLNRDLMNENVAKKIVVNYLHLWRNHEFQVNKIESKGEKFEASVTVSGDFMNRIFAVDKHTGWVQLQK